LWFSKKLHALACLFVAVQQDDYYVAGVAMAVTIAHEGPAPAFLAKELFAALVGNPDKVLVIVYGLPDSPMKQDLLEVCFLLIIMLGVACVRQLNCLKDCLKV